MDRIEKAGQADPAFLATFLKWRFRDERMIDRPERANALGVLAAGAADVPFVDAVLAMVIEMPEFRKSSPIDGLIPWFAKQMDNEFKRAAEDHRIPPSRYARLPAMLAVEPVLIEWFEQKKPNLSKLDASDVFDAIEKFEEDREPEVVYTGKTQGWEDGNWDVVKLATKTQIQKVGAALNNCLRKGSSYTEGYCEQARTGKSEFFALRQDGEPVLSIQWSPGKDEPEQVYGEDNTEPEGEAEEKVDEWIESRGGKRRRWGHLSASARAIAEYIEEQGHHEDDESIAGYASEWDDAFSVDNAKAWIDAIGPYDTDLARKLDDEKLDAEDFGKLPSPVREYIFEHWQDGGRSNDRLEEVISLGMLANEFIDQQGNRADNAPKPKVSSQIGFSHKGHEGFGREEWAEEERARRQKAADAEVAEKLLGGLKLSGPRAEESAPFLVEAKKWFGAGWADRDYFDDAGDWWAHWFAPDEAAIYYFDLAHVDHRGQGVPLEVAEQLRDRGITAQDVLDAARTWPKTLNVHNADAIAEAVAEDRRLHANKRRRRTSRRPARLARPR
jgi:hypothetical protein